MTTTPAAATTGIHDAARTRVAATLVRLPATPTRRKCAERHRVRVRIVPLRVPSVNFAPRAPAERRTHRTALALRGVHHARVHVAPQRPPREPHRAERDGDDARGAGAAHISHERRVACAGRPAHPLAGGDPGVLHDEDAGVFRGVRRQIGRERGRGCGVVRVVRGVRRREMPGELLELFEQGRVCVRRRARGVGRVERAFVHAGRRVEAVRCVARRGQARRQHNRAEGSTHIGRPPRLCRRGRRTCPRTRVCRPSRPCRRAGACASPGRCRA